MSEKNIGNNFVEKIKGVEPTKIIMALAVLLIAIAAIFTIGFTSSDNNTTNKGLLYSGLSEAETGEIITRLEGMNINYELSPQGALYVDNSEKARLRMLLAQEGLPKQTIKGYEILDEQNPIGTTSFMQEVNRQRALEGEIARTISSLNSVETVRVHLVMPEKTRFAVAQNKPTGSVTISTRGGIEINKEEAHAIRLIVANAVPGMKVTDVSVVDSNGIVLADKGTLNSWSDATDKETKIEHDIINMLTPLIGPNRVKVDATIELDNEYKEVKEKLYDPKSRVVRSTSIQENTRNSVDKNNSVNVNNNIPNGNQGAASGSQEDSSNVSETTNYEISSSDSISIINPGSVKRLSLAVIIDGKYEEGNYISRTPEEIQEIEDIVKSAVGFDELRGDSIKVSSMEFGEPEGTLVGGEEEGSNGFPIDTTTIIQILAILIIVGLAFFFIIKPLSSKNVVVETSEMKESNQYNEENQEDIEAKFEEEQKKLEKEAELEEMMNMKRIEGRMKVNSVRSIHEIINRYPDEAVRIIKTWINEEEL